MAAILLDSKLIPRIDMTWPEDKIAEAVEQAALCDGPGFFYILNHGIEESIFENAIRESHEFYHSPKFLDERLQVSSLNQFGRWGIKGYAASGSEGAYAKDEVTDVRPEKAGVKLNTREVFVVRFPEMEAGGESDENGDSDGTPMYMVDYGRFFREKAATAADGLPLKSFFPDSLPTADVQLAVRQFFHPNPWPRLEAFPRLKPAATAYFEKMYGLAERVFELYENLLKSKTPHDRGMTTFNLARYGREEGSGNFGISDHTDWVLFTLLYPSYFNEKVGLCDAEGRRSVFRSGGGGNGMEDLIFTGLEAWYADRWISVPHIPGAIILNQGEMLSRLSGGKFKAPVHRVKANVAGGER